MSQGSRTRELENEESARIIIVTADPNGSVTDAETTFAWDTINKKMYVNSDGATAWVALN